MQKAEMIQKVEMIQKEEVTQQKLMIREIRIGNWTEIVV